MIVGVDARHLAGGRGVTHFTAAMLAALGRLPEDDEWRAFVPGLGAPAVPIGVTAARHPLPSRALFGPAALAGRPRLDRLLGGDADVVWAPAPAPLRVSPGVPLVVTVHDLSWLERPGDFTPYERAWHRLGRLDRLLARADRVVAVSQATADVLDRRLGVAAHVIRSGATRRRAGALPRGLPERFVLHVGALEPRKDPELLVRAHALARRRGLDADLVFAGTGRLADRLAAPGVHLLGAVGDAALGALYERALAVAMPSRLEGFGLPPLEAALAGTPSVVSDLPAFRETLGDAAVVVAPGDAEALAGGLLRVVADREALGPRARQAAGALSWDRAAAELRAVLAEVAR